jgi:allantoin racemase
LHQRQQRKGASPQLTEGRGHAPGHDQYDRVHDGENRPGGEGGGIGGTQILAVNPELGPVSIEGHYDEAISVPGLLIEIAKAEHAGADAHVIACFDDTGLEAARCVAGAPVIGIGEAAFHLASLVAHRFSVITTLSRSIAAIETNLMKYGLERRCGRVRAAEVPVLALEDPASGARAEIAAQIEKAKAEDRAEAIVLGCVLASMV